MPDSLVFNETIFWGRVISVHLIVGLNTLTDSRRLFAPEPSPARLRSQADERRLRRKTMTKAMNIRKPPVMRLVPMAP